MVSIIQVQDTKLDFTELDKFHKDAGQDMPPTGVYPYDTAYGSEILYMTLVKEEYKELEEALLALTSGNTDDGSCDIKGFANIAKEALDCIVVLVGLLKSLGIPTTECWDELMRELASKRLPNGDFLRRDDGKILKPDTFKKADIVRVLNEATDKREAAMKNIDRFL